jgi:methyl-accepting chemotaxis protein
MGHIRGIYDEFEKRGGRVAVIMAESLPRMQEFLKKHEYPFPLLSDVRRQVVRDYGVYVRMNFESVNISRPAEVIVDTDKTVKYIYVASIQTDFPKDETIFTALDSLKPGSSP